MSVGSLSGMSSGGVGLFERSLPVSALRGGSGLGDGGESGGGGGGEGGGGGGGSERLSLEARFAAFDASHPEVWRLFCRLVDRVRAKGFTHYSAKTIIEVLRFHSDVDGRPGGDRYKLNNDFTACYARKWRAEHADAADFFETRRSVMDGGRAGVARGVGGGGVGGGGSGGGLGVHSRSVGKTFASGSPGFSPPGPGRLSGRPGSLCDVVA